MPAKNQSWSISDAMNLMSDQDSLSTMITFLGSQIDMFNFWDKSDK